MNIVRIGMNKKIKIMSNYIHWQECDKWITPFNPLNKQTDAYKPYQIKRELVCDHPLVDRVWFYGGMALNQPDAKAYLNFEMLFKDGARFSLRDVSDEDFETAHLVEAEVYLDSIKDNILPESNYLSYPINNDES